MIATTAPSSLHCETSNLCEAHQSDGFICQGRRVAMVAKTAKDDDLVDQLTRVDQIDYGFTRGLSDMTLGL